MTATTSSGHQKLLAMMGAPRQSDQLEQWVAWAFDWPLDDAKRHLETVESQLSEVDPHETHFAKQMVMPGICNVCCKLGLPCDPMQHEQPYLLLKLSAIPIASLSLYEFATASGDTERPMESLTPIILLLWDVKLRECVDQYLAMRCSTDDALRDVVTDMTWVGFKLIALMWSDSVRSEVEQLLFYGEYLTFTRGCFDLESGDLTPEGREIAAMREYLFRYGRAK